LKPYRPPAYARVGPGLSGERLLRAGLYFPVAVGTGGKELSPVKEISPMPIFEFKCSDCEEFFEFLFMKSEEEKEMKCPKCGSFSLERVVSVTNFSMTGAGPKGQKATVSKQERNCSSGSCSTYTIPGESRG
jgi:putative FmdB family regulatory protein